LNILRQILRKPGSVLADHLSSHSVATVIKRISPMDSGGKPSRFQEIIHHLAADRVYLFATSPLQNVGSYPTLFTLIPINRDGIVSVALSLGFPPVAVSNCLSLRCPDFPLTYVNASDQPIVWLKHYYNT
jgi:hypothetical protein